MTKPVKLFYTLLGITAVLVLIECMVRISGYGYKKPPKGYQLVTPKKVRVTERLIPHSKGWIEKTYAEFNSIGLRDKEYSLKRKSDHFRIFVLGSEVTFGHGLELEKTYTKKLETKLNEKPPPNKQYEVICGGIPRIEMYKRINFFSQEGIKYNPDFLIFCWKMRNRKWKRIRSRRALWTKIFLYKIIPLMPQESYLTWFLYDKARLYKREFYWKEELKENGGAVGLYNKIYSETNPAWVGEKKAIEGLLQFAQERKIPVLMVIFPYLNSFAENHPFLHVYSEITSLADRYGIKSLNLLDNFRDIEPSKLWISRYDHNPNEDAHTMISQAIYHELMEKGGAP